MNEESVTTSISAPNVEQEMLKKYFSHCFDKQGNFDIEKFKEEISSKEINFSKESFSMEFLGKSYARLLASDEATTLLQEDTNWNLRDENSNSENLLLKGDNLEVLKHLSNAYQERVKMIYIDPPYNTGSDGFVYEDDRTFNFEELSKLAGVDEEKAKRILQFTRSKSNSHSAWLTFMYPRLYIAKQLLKDDGVIFISIDDNEVAQLRLLMDEIFGEENFVACLVQKARGGISNDKVISNNHNYVLMYSKVYEKIHEVRKLFGVLRTETDFKTYNKDDKDGKGVYTLNPVTGPGGARKGNPYYEILGIENYWRYGKETMNKLIEEGKIVKVNSSLYQKTYKKDLENTKKGASTWLDKMGTTQEGTSEIKELFEGETVFDFPKPTKLVKFLLEFIDYNENDIILDFFAGSGTTADAVMQLNAQDKKEGKEGNRKFILVQLPEKIDEKKSKTAYDFVKNELKIEKPTIFDITKERIIRASKKIREENSLENSQEFNFKVFQTIPIWNDYKVEEKEFSPQTTLFDESKLKEEDLHSLLTTWKTYDGVELTQNIEEIKLENYTAYYTNEKLYLMNKSFQTNHLKALINKIDEDREFNPKIIVLFGYNFQSKMLREITENIKHYSNKKNADIEVITRY